jgi:tRNA-modifying protein YgfZ
VATLESDTFRVGAEYEALTAGCALLDRSQRGKLALTGAGALEFLDGQVTNELAGLVTGEGRYAAFLTHKGKMLGDLRILAVGPNPGEPPAELTLDTERVALQALFDMIRRFKIGYRVELHKRTLQRGLLSLIGPQATAVAAAAGARETLGRLASDEHANATVQLGDIEALAVRTVVGIDLFCEVSQTGVLTELLRPHGAIPASEAAAEILRIERGEPRYGVDLDDTVIPQEAGLNDRAVSFTKGCYVGQETVARLHYKGKPNRHLRGLRLSAPFPAGSELRLGDRVVGHLTSTALSPTLGPIGLALMRREAQPGTRVEMIDGDPPPEGTASAEVVELPFLVPAD